jgi:hypothetical protein
MSFSLRQCFAYSVHLLPYSPCQSIRTPWGGRSSSCPSLRTLLENPRREGLLAQCWPVLESCSFACGTVRFAGGAMQASRSLQPTPLAAAELQR